MSKNKPECRVQLLAQALRRIGVGVLLSLLFSISIFAGGVFDPDFGTGGKVNFRFGETSDSVVSAALQPDGKIVLAGLTRPSGQSNGLIDFAIARLNANGTLDKTFGSGGKVVTAFGFQLEDIPQAVVIQPDGKILAGGRSAGVFALARYNADGSLDKTFGGGGKVTTDFPESINDGIGYLFLLPDGKIVAVGGLMTSDQSPEGQGQIGAARYNTDGSLDTTFGNNGRFRFWFGNLITYLDGAAMQPDGKLLISGSYVYNIPGCVPTPHMSCGAVRNFLTRYNQMMRPDIKFGVRGKTFIQNKSYGLSVESDGSILAGGWPLAVRYSFHGTSQTVFDEVIFPNQSPGLQNGPHSLTQRPNGTIAGCRVTRAAGNSDVGVVLFNADGDVIGLDQRDFFGGDDDCSKILVQPDSKVLVVGRAQLEAQGNSSFLAMRYLDITP